MNQKYLVFNDNGSISQFYSSINEAISFVETTMQEALSDFQNDGIMPQYINDLCVVEIKYYVQRSAESLELIKL